MGRSGKDSFPIDRVLMLIVAMVVAASGLGSRADEPASKGEDVKKAEEAAKLKEAALKAADSYLVLLDRGKYAESWDASAEDLRKGLPRGKWVDALTKTRRPFGRPRSRKLNRIEMRATEDPRRVDQAWVYSDLRTSSGESCGELAIVFFERGKEWKVSGYFIGDPATFPKLPAGEKDARPAEKRPDAGRGGTH